MNMREKRNKSLLHAVTHAHSDFILPRIRPLGTPTVKCLLVQAFRVKK